MSSSLVRSFPLVLVALAACARGSAGGSLEAKLPVSPGAAWDTAGAVARPSVRTVTLTAPSPAAGCDRARDDLLKALGSDWTAGDLRLGAVTATKGTTRSARIVCTGSELSVSIVG